MTSRLDRLFVLLESGSSAATRNAAAKQLGEVQRLHPHELHTLLGRISVLLRAPSWDTRVAASQAVAAILSATPQWNPTPIEIKKDNDEDRKPQFTGKLRLQQLDMEQVLSKSNHLMGSEGNEYDLDEDTKSLHLDGKERLAYQRQQLNAKLGLDFAAKIGIDMSGMLSNEDLINSHTPQTKLSNDTNLNKQHISEVIKISNDAGLSSREINRARRKARQAVNKQRSREPPNNDECGTSNENDFPDRKRIKLENDFKVKEEFPILGDCTPDATGNWGPDAIEWPLENFFENLCIGLFSSSWETRHGAATTMRELLRTHGKGAGRLAYSTAEEMEEHHQLWLEDTATRLLCVLALDRFGDFVSDAVVAPVRETAAQCLGTTMSIMTPEAVQHVKKLLLQLLQQKEWEARHGGLLGLKYMLAVREDLVPLLLPDAFPSILSGLSDAVDDVGAVAAAALIPVAPALVKLLPEAVAPVVSRLWELLGEQDELAAACNSFMGLLAAILSLPESQSLLPPISLADVVPRLWPYLCHSTSSVRRATLQTLRTLTQVQSNIGEATNANLHWNAELLQDALRHVFQRVLVEHIGDVQEIVEEVWNNLVQNSGLAELLHAACPFVSTWICLTMQPAKLPFDASLLIQSRSLKERRSRMSNDLYSQTGTDLSQESLNHQQKWFIGGSETTPLPVREANVMRARCMSARMLGLLSSYIVKPAPGIIYTPDIESPVDCYVKVLVAYLQSKSALQRMMTGLIIAEWARIDTQATRPCPDALKQRLHICLTECLYFDEIAVSFTRLLQETKDFIATLKHYKICPENISNAGSVLTLDQISRLSDNTMANIITEARLKPKVMTSLEERRRSINSSAQSTVKEQQVLTISSLSALAGACTYLEALPDKLNPVVKPLMESIKRENEERLQATSANSLAKLVTQCITREPCPNAKIVSNLCTLLCSDPDFTPKIIVSETPGSVDSGVDEGSRAATPVISGDQFSGILTLTNMQKTAEKAALRRTNSSTGRGPGRPPVIDVPIEDLFVDDDAQKSNQIQRRGAMLALTSITEYLGSDLPTKLPRLWELIVSDLSKSIDPEYNELTVNSATAAESLVSSLQVLEVCAGSVHSTLLPIILEIALPRLAKLLTHTYRAVRHLAARCLASIAKLAPVSVMELVVEKILPLLGAVHFDTHRQGAVEALACIVDSLQFNVVPFVTLLIVPLLGRMSDQNESVRLMATHSFATLVQLMPLDGAVPEPNALSESLRGQRERERSFLRQLLTPSTIPDYKIAIPIEAELRSYQQAGINWLAFLNQYKLHGILCDDMGLGKTLQSICMLASDHYYRDQKYKETQAIDCAPLPSLVICPPTLTGHWVYEVEKFLSAKYLKPLQFVGPPAEREKLRHKVKHHNLIVASYEIVRKDIDFFSAIKWNYCVLDEGHIIKNGKTKSSKAIKQLTANHRLILSGTPIQNNVLELWSLFDFLMPGFLGTEKQFTARFSRPILASRDPKSSPKEQEAGAIAMESLHRQVLPFLLRRMKEDVLDDLPPKITQDYYCELSPLQEQLYEDFSRSQAHQSLQESFTASTGNNSNASGHTNHIFQALRYLQNVCNHPKLVLTPAHPLYTQMMNQLQQQNMTLDNIQHAAKLPALKQLLIDLGIGAVTPPSSTSTEIIINQHRALIFCQLKVMLDILEKDLFKTHLPGVTYLRLDGSIPPAQRHALVTRFNNDPSIDVLLLTTQVGGLGLNLTGADTVIFVEHDWNPTRDLQAMDRAHRIGQRRVVNVYRLITRHTLEEKIMGLQKFKLLTANTVISGENSSLNTMGTGDLLDLFSHQPESSNSGNNQTNNGGNGPATMKSVLEGLPDLWDHKQYEEEYDLTNFVKNLRN